MSTSRSAYVSSIVLWSVAASFSKAAEHDAFLGLVDDRQIAVSVAPSRRGLVVGIAFDF
jgi:hypothetical protein